MPRHVVVSPEEDLAAFYGGADPVATSGAALPPLEPPAPIAPELSAPQAAEPPPRAAPPPRAEPPPPPRPISPPPVSPRTAPPVARPPAQPSVNAPDPMVAGLASLIVPGLGQILAGQSMKGLVLLIIAFPTCGMGGLLNIVAAADAYLIAQRRKRGEVVQDWQFF